jgi:hypothetical protein
MWRRVAIMHELVVHEHVNMNYSIPVLYVPGFFSSRAEHDGTRNREPENHATTWSGKFIKYLGQKILQATSK